MLKSTDGLPGPVVIYIFGNPAVIIPRCVIGPSDHLSFNDSLLTPLTLIPQTAPVRASKPVAKIK
jgi:hypothetical protein